MSPQVVNTIRDVFVAEVLILVLQTEGQPRATIEIVGLDRKSSKAVIIAMSNLSALSASLLSDSGVDSSSMSGFEGRNHCILGNSRDW